MDINYLIANRKYLRTQVTKIFNIITTNFDELSKSEKLQYQAKLESIQSNLKSIDEKVLAEIWKEEASESKLNKELESSSHYEEKIFESLIKLKSNFILSPQPHTLGGNQLKLPILPLPECSHAKGESYDRFIFNLEKKNH